MKELACEHYARTVKRGAGWLFAVLLNRRLGDGSLVLVQEGPGGSDLEFSATAAWLVANNPKRFGVSLEKAAEFLDHVENCQTPQCREANKRVSAIIRFFHQEKSPGDTEIALVRGTGQQACRLIRQECFGPIIDEVKPLIEWFTKDRNLWVWPEED